MKQIASEVPGKVLSKSTDFKKPTNKIYHLSHHACFSCVYHIVFCPKYRRKVLDTDIAERLKELVYEKQAEYKFVLLEIEVMPDHVHILIDADIKESIDNTVAKIKGYTSNRLRKEFPSLKKRLPTLWTRAKFISSVGAVSLDVVKQYIENQKLV